MEMLRNLVLRNACLNGLTVKDYMVDGLEKEIDFELKYLLTVP